MAVAAQRHPVPDSRGDLAGLSGHGPFLGCRLYRCRRPRGGHRLDRGRAFQYAHSRLGLAAARGRHRRDFRLADARQPAAFGRDDSGADRHLGLRSGTDVCGRLSGMAPSRVGRLVALPDRGHPAAGAGLSDDGRRPFRSAAGGLSARVYLPAGRLRQPDRGLRHAPRGQRAPAAGARLSVSADRIFLFAYPYFRFAIPAGLRNFTHG